VNALRTIAFRIVFFGLSVPIIGTVPITALIAGRRGMIGHARVWSRFHRWAARTIMGITVRVEGERPTGPVLYAVKHQAMFETVELADLLEGPGIVLKQELTRIPFWGWATGIYGRVSVDREASAAALRSMMRDAAALKVEGRSILLFPEGTRVPPGEQPPLRSGFAGLYKVLKMPVVPIATDTGYVWPRHGWKRPGVVTIRFCEVVPPGLPREEAERRVHAAINELERS
jgi:1-acyl-sn-glycerol-3-phosphate acyltransferase